MRKVFIVTVGIMFLFSSGCAKRSKNISAEFVPSSQYSGYGCKQLAATQEQLRDTLAEASDQQDKSATADALLLTAGMLVFWPALIAMPFTGNNKHEIAQYKGELKAMNDEYNRRCLDDTPALDKGPVDKDVITKATLEVPTETH